MTTIAPRIAHATHDAETQRNESRPNMPNPSNPSSHDGGGRDHLEHTDTQRPHPNFSRAKGSRKELALLRYEVATWSAGFQDLRPAPGGRFNDPPVEKLCSQCQKWLPIDRFRPNPRMRHGLNSRCKECQLERTRRWRREHPEAEQRYNAERRARYREEHPRAERACVQCGRPFTGRPDALVCSPGCRRARKREQRRERHRRAAAEMLTIPKGFG